MQQPSMVVPRAVYDWSVGGRPHALVDTATTSKQVSPASINRILAQHTNETKGKKCEYSL
jgi:hypothetical protein